MKKKQNKPLGVSGLQIILALSLISISAVLLASGIRSAGSGGGSRSVAGNPADATVGQATAPRPAVVSPFSDEELAEYAEIDADIRAAERARKLGPIQSVISSDVPLQPDPPSGVTPALQPYWQATTWLQRGRPVIRDISQWQTLQAEAGRQRALEWGWV